MARIDPHNKGYISYLEFLDRFEARETKVSEIQHTKGRPLDFFMGRGVGMEYFENTSLQHPKSKEMKTTLDKLYIMHHSSTIKNICYVYQRGRQFLY